MVRPARQRFDFEAYVALEQDSPIKHEFLDGVVWAMAGGSPEHAGIAANLARYLGNQLAGQRCRVFTSALRVRVKATGLATYPDLTIVCGQIETDPEDPKGHTVTNPRAVIEVLSPTSEDDDRGEKLDHYRQIRGLEQIVLVGQSARQVETWRRVGERWTHETVVAPGELDVIGCRLVIDDIYRDPLG